MDHRDSMPAIGGGEIVTSSTNIEEIINVLGAHGCPNVTSLIDHNATGNFPCAGGGFCDVYRGKLRGGTNIAIKAMRVYARPEEIIDSDCLKSLKRTARELYHWSKMAHSNVLPLIGLAVFRGQISMISEWMENGSLISFVRVNPNATRTKLCIDVCKGLCYLHLNGMVHGDLKAANVVVSPKGDAIITDFGNTKLKDIAMSLKFTDTTSRAHSVRWTAPELLLEADGPPVSKEGDVYAYGMTALETLTGKAPYDGLDEKRVIISVLINKRTPTRPGAGIDDDLWAVLESCWIHEESKRPGITAVNSRLQGLFAHGPSQPRRVGEPGDTTNANKQGLDQLFATHAVTPSMRPEVIGTRCEAVESPMQLKAGSNSTQAKAQNVDRHHSPASCHASQPIAPVNLASVSSPPTPGPSSSLVYAEPYPSFAHTRADPLQLKPTRFGLRECNIPGVVEEEFIPIPHVSAPDPLLGLPHTDWLLGSPQIGVEVSEHGAPSSPRVQLPRDMLGRSTGAYSNIENIQDPVDDAPLVSRVQSSVHIDAGTKDSTRVTLEIPRSALLPQHLAHGEQGDSRLSVPSASRGVGSRDEECGPLPGTRINSEPETIHTLSVFLAPIRSSSRGSRDEERGPLPGISSIMDQSEQALPAVRRTRRLSEATPRAFRSSPGREVGRQIEMDRAALQHHSPWASPRQTRLDSIGGTDLSLSRPSSPEAASTLSSSYSTIASGTSLSSILEDRRTCASPGPIQLPGVAQLNSTLPHLRSHSARSAFELSDLRTSLPSEDSASRGSLTRGHLRSPRSNPPSSRPTSPAVSTGGSPLIHPLTRRLRSLKVATDEDHIMEQMPNKDVSGQPELPGDIVPVKFEPNVTPPPRSPASEGISHNLTYMMPLAPSVAQLGFKLQPHRTRRPELEARMAQRRQKIEELQREEQADAAAIAIMSNTWSSDISLGMMGMLEHTPAHPLHLGGFNSLPLGMLQQDTMDTSSTMPLLGPDPILDHPSPSPSFQSEFSSGSYTGLPGMTTAPSPVSSVSLASPPPMSLPGSITGMESFRTSQLMEPIGKDEARPFSTNPSGPGMHKCESCGKTFRRPSGLKDHVNIHSGEKPYCCPLETCRKGFATRSNMVRHHNKTHPGRAKIGGVVDISADTNDGYT